MAHPERGRNWACALTDCVSLDLVARWCCRLLVSGWPAASPPSVDTSRPIWPHSHGQTSYGAHVPPSPAPAAAASCLEAQQHTLRLQLADIEARAEQIVLQQPAHIQQAVEQFLQRNLAGALQQVLSDMVKEEFRSGGNSGSSGGGSGDTDMNDGQSPPAAAAAAATFAPSRLPPPATVPMHTTPEPIAATAAASAALAAAVAATAEASTALEGWRAEVASLDEELSAAQEDLLSKDPSLRDATARESKLASIRAEDASGVKIKDYALRQARNALKGVLEFIEEKQGERQEAQNKVEAAEQELAQRQRTQAQLQQQAQLQSRPSYQSPSEQQSRAFAPASAAASAPASRFAAELATLSARGFSDRDFNLSLLDTLNGNVELVERTLVSEFSVVPFAEELSALEQHGFHDRALNTQLLQKKNGAVQDVILQLQRLYALKASLAPPVATQPPQAAAASVATSHWQAVPAASQFSLYSPAPAASVSSTAYSSPAAPATAYSSPAFSSAASDSGFSSASSFSDGGVHVKSEFGRKDVSSAPSTPAAAAAAAAPASVGPRSWAPTSLAEAEREEGPLPPELNILRLCGFRAFDFSYRTSAVNHLKSLLRDKLKVSASELATDIWHFEPRYNVQGIQEWRSYVSFRKFQAAPSSWYLVKTQSTEESAIHALTHMKHDRELKNVFLRAVPPVDELNPISAVRNALRDRSAWKKSALEEHIVIQNAAFQCRLMYGEAEIGRGTGAEKVFAKTDASIDTLRRWNAAIEFIKQRPTEELSRYRWLELTE